MLPVSFRGSHISLPSTHITIQLLIKPLSSASTISMSFNPKLVFVTSSFFIYWGVWDQWLCPCPSASRIRLCFLPSFVVVSLFRIFFFLSLLVLPFKSSVLKLKDETAPFSLIASALLPTTSHLTPITCNLTCGLFKISTFIFSMENVSSTMVKILVCSVH